MIITLLSNCNLNAENIDKNKLIETIQSISLEHSNKFGRVLIQDTMGKLKPIDSLSSEILSKISKKSDFYGLDSNQVVLGMLAKPELWQKIKMIKVSNKGVNKLLGGNNDTKYFSFSQFFDFKRDNAYILSKEVEVANRKRPATRDKFDKEILKVDERINVAYMTYTGNIFRMFPQKDNSNNKWFSPMEAMKIFPQDKGNKIQNMITEYFNGIKKGIETSNWNEADKKLNDIIEFQKENGKNIYLSEDKIDMEILYNNIQIFKQLIPVFGFTGFILLILSFIKIFRNKIDLTLVTQIATGILILSFLAQTFGLGLRWYISGHAPWSDGYESMIYISWATILAGFIFSKNSPITLSATSILTALILFVAHLSWLDPQISNLVPVLKSYWLTIHVSMITASYGFLGLGALLGFINLILFILKNQNIKFISLTIKELTYVSEMTLIVGLILLTIGNFLGGVWANESWGRYWGWDPKESWALITIIIYAFILHMRFIPNLKSIYAFNIASVIGYSSVIMTYFGVNFYLSGLHSYAKGDPIPVPNFVFYTIAILFVIIVLAYKNRILKK